MANDTRKRLANALNEAGYDIGSYDEFDRRMNNAADRRKFFDAVNNAGYDLGSFEDFDRRISETKYHGKTKDGKLVPMSEADYIRLSKTKPMSQTAEQRARARVKSPQTEVGKQAASIGQEVWGGQTAVPKSIEQPIDYSKPGALFTQMERERARTEEALTKPVEEVAKAGKENQFTPERGGVQYVDEKGNVIKDETYPAYPLKPKEVWEDEERKSYLESINYEKQAREMQKSVKDALLQASKETGMNIGDGTRIGYAMSNMATDEYGNPRIKSREELEREKKAAPKMDAVIAANEAINSAVSLIDEIGKQDGENGFKTLARNTVKGAADASIMKTLSDLANNSEVMKAMEQYKKDKSKLTEEQKMLLDAVAINATVQSVYQPQMNSWAKAGETTGFSIPFMIDLAMNPLSGLGNAWGKSAGKKVLDMAVKRGVNGATRSVTKGMSRAARASAIIPQMAGNVASAGFVTATIGSPRVIKDTQERMMGEVQSQYDENGGIHYAGAEKGEDMSTALWKSYLSNTIENFTEIQSSMTLGSLGFVGKMMPGSDLLLQGFRKSKFGRWVKGMQKSPIGGFTTRAMKETSLHEYPGEVLEEIEGGIISGMLVDDKSFSEAWGETMNKEQLLETGLGLVPMSAFSAVMRVGGYGIAARQAKVKLKKADEEGQKMYGSEGWAIIKQTIDNSKDVNELKSVLLNEVLGGQYDTDQRQAAMQYAFAREGYKGIVLGEAAASNLQYGKSTGIKDIEEEGNVVRLLNAKGEVIEESAFDDEEKKNAYIAESRMRQRNDQMLDDITKMQKKSKMRGEMYGMGVGYTSLFTDEENAKFIEEAMIEAGYDESRGAEDPLNKAIAAEITQEGTVPNDILKEKVKAYNPLSNLSREVSEQFGITEGELQRILDKDPLKRTKSQQQIVDVYSQQIHELANPKGELHLEESSQDGAASAESGDIGIEGLDPQVLSAEKQRYEEAVRAKDEALKRNQAMAMRIEELEAYGADPAVILSELSDFDEEDVKAVVEGYNAENRWQSFLSTANKNFEQTANRETERRTFKGTLNGKEDTKNAISITDGEHEYWLTAGDITTDGDGRVVSGGNANAIVAIDENGDMVVLSPDSKYTVENWDSLEDFREAYLQSLKEQSQMAAGIPLDDGSPSTESQGTDGTGNAAGSAGGEAGAGTDTGANEPSATAATVTGQDGQGGAAGTDGNAEGGVGGDNATVIPTNEKGRKMYHLGVDIDAAIDDITNDENEDRTPAEVADMRIKTAKKKLDELNKSKKKEAKQYDDNDLDEDEYDDVKAAKKGQELPYNTPVGQYAKERIEQDAIVDYYTKLKERYQIRENERMTAEILAGRERNGVLGGENGNGAGNVGGNEDLGGDVDNVPDWSVDKASDARARGFRMENGHRVDRREPITEKVEGKEVDVKFDNQEEPVKGKIAVVDAGKLVPSHSNGQRNVEFFITEAQPKERTDAASDAASSAIAQNVNPAEITGGVTAYVGSPIVNSRGEVIQGNNRTIGMQKMWGNGQYAMSQAQYKQYLIDHAEEFGLNADEVAAMKNPVMVRMVDVSDEEAIRLGQKTASNTESGGKERIDPERAIQAMQMSDQLRVFMSLLFKGEQEGQTLANLIVENGREVLQWMNRSDIHSKFISDTQYQSALDKNGNLTEEAKSDIKKIVESTLFQDAPDRLKDMFYSMPVKAQNAILATFYRDGKSPEAARIIKDIQKAIEAYAIISGRSEEFRNAKDVNAARNAVKDVQKQTEMFGNTGTVLENFDNFALELAILFKAKKQNDIRAAFNDYYDAVQGVGEADIFSDGSTQKSRAEAIKAVWGVEETNNNTNNLTGKENGNQGSNVVGNDGSSGTSGQRGSTGESGVGEQVEGGERPAVGAGGTEGNGGRPEGAGTDSNDDGQVGGSPATEPQGIDERSQYIASHPLTEAEIDASEAPQMRKLLAKQYLSGENVTELAKTAYTSIYNKKSSQSGQGSNNTQNEKEGGNGEQASGNKPSTENPSKPKGDVASPSDNVVKPSDSSNTEDGGKQVTDKEAEAAAKARAIIDRMKNRGKKGSNNEFSSDDFFNDDTPAKEKPQADGVPEKGKVQGISKLKELFDRYATDEEQKELAKKVFAVAEKLGIKCSFLHEDLGFGIGGIQDGDVLKIARITTLEQNKDKMPNVLLHETIHGVTTYAIDAYRNGELKDAKLVEAVEELLDVYKKIKNDESIKREYGVKNAKEMIAELANPAFRNKLKRLNMWERLKEAIRKIFFFDDAKSVTAERVLTDALDKMLDNYNYSLFEDYERTREYKEVSAYSINGLSDEQIDDMLDLVEAGAELGYTLFDTVKTKEEWKAKMQEYIGAPIKDAIGYSDADVEELLEDLWNAPYAVDGNVKNVSDWAKEKGIVTNENSNGNGTEQEQEGNGDAGVQPAVGTGNEAGSGEGRSEVSDTGEVGTGGNRETGSGTNVSGGNRGSRERPSTSEAGDSRESGNATGTTGGGTGRRGTGRGSGRGSANDLRGTERTPTGTSKPGGTDGVGRDTSVKKPTDISKEKVPYQHASIGGKYAIGSVLPSGVADAVSQAFERLKEQRKKEVLDFVRDELGYSSNEEMLSDFESGKTDGLASEQVDAVALSINAMKNGKSFIVGDMTGVGKGRTAAALIRWGKKQGKKVLFVTEKSGLFSDMYRDIKDIGSDYMPFVANSDTQSNITDAEGNKVIPKPSKQAQSALWQTEGDELPRDKKGRQYDFLMMTYSQAGNVKGQDAQNKIEWIKNYAKDAIVIMDESHNASGESNVGEYFKDIVKQAGGVTFLSATYAKRPDNMMLYALRSSMSETHMSQGDMLEAIKSYGIPMQEIMASALFGSGEMIRRERDFSDVKTTWTDPKIIYSEEEYEQCRKTSDKTMDLVNDIIRFQREYVNPIVKEHEKEFNEQNAAAAMMRMPQRHAANTSYKSQVSNILGLMVYSMKARKAAQMAIEQIKQGKKPVIAVENTFGSYVDELGDEIESADFGPIFDKGVKFSLKYSISDYTIGEDGKYHKDNSTEQILDAEEELDSVGKSVLENLRQRIQDYLADNDKVDLSISPIDLIKQMISDAGYQCGEITGRSSQLQRNDDGSGAGDLFEPETRGTKTGYKKIPFRTDKKKAAIKFNGGTSEKPLPESEQYQALIINVAGATGISLHASNKFGNQQPRTMIILQPARNVNTEVQMRGRIDRTGQVHRGEYFYITSPIPAEQKITMMLKQKLSSLDAQSVGTKDVSSNKVESQDMDNKYGDEVCYNFLIEHLNDINAYLENGLTYNNKTREWEGRKGLLYDVLKDIQRLDCNIQEMIINELTQRYADQIDYLNQNGINDLETHTMDLEATTIDKATFVKGKNNESINEFAHDTAIERVEVNLLKKPMHDSDIRKKMKELGAFDSEGNRITGSDYASIIDEKIEEWIAAREAERKEKDEASLKKLEDKIRSEHPKKEGTSDEDYEKMIKTWPSLLDMQRKQEADFSQYHTDMQKYLNSVFRMAMNMPTGRPCLVPLTDDVGSDAAMMYGRFLGVQLKRKGDPRSAQAVFAVKDSRVQISIPIVNKERVIEKILNERNDIELQSEFKKSEDDWEEVSDEEMMKRWGDWWDKMIPKNTSRQIRYMITGNVLQACGSLGKYKGQIVTFTRKNKETGEITLERGMLLAENFDPENFQVRRQVEKKDVWDHYDEVKDEKSGISCAREGNTMSVTFTKRKGEKLSEHPAQKDEKLRELAMNGEIRPSGRTAILVIIKEENIDAALEHLYKEYGYTKEELFVMPDSTEKPDAIVYTNESWQSVIERLRPKYGREWGLDGKIEKALKRYRMDVNNEGLKEQIREMSQLRQAYIRQSYASNESERLAWQVLIYDQRIERYKEDKEERERYYRLREAILEELAFRGFKGTSLHLEQGVKDVEFAKELFDKLNKNDANAKIFEMVYARLQEIGGMQIIFDETISNDTGGYVNKKEGRKINYNWKYMNAEYISDQAKADTILHEMIHTLTVYAIDIVQNDEEHLFPESIRQEMVDAVNELNDIYNNIRGNDEFYHKEGSGSALESTWEDYGISNIYEMLSEAASNAGFRERLKKVNLWVKLKSGILKFFGFESGGGKKISSHDAIMERLDILLENFSKEAWESFYNGRGYGDRWSKMEKKAGGLETETRGTDGRLNKKGERARRFTAWIIRRLRRAGVNVQKATNEEVERMMNTGYDANSSDATEMMKVTDEATIKRLDAEKKRTGYRTVVLNSDGTFGSPMAGKLGSKGTKKEKTKSFRLNEWEQSEEHPELATSEGKINLIKPGGRGSVDGVDYNPYVHARLDKVNAQFSQAWMRPELVYIETELPESEFGEQRYHAEKAKLSTGLHDWNNGALMLSRYDKPKRVVDWEEVADDWEKKFKDSGVTFDIVNPQLLPILAERGVEILPPKKAAGKKCLEAYNEWKKSGKTGQVEFLRTSEGVVYGWHDSDGIHLTEDGFNPNTPVHEYTHGYMRMLEQSNPSLYEKVVEALKTSDVWKEVESDKAYQHLKGNESAIASEVASRLSCRYSETLADASVSEKIKEALKALWEWVKRRVLHTDVDADMIPRMVMSEIIRGTNVDNYADNAQTEAQIEQTEREQDIERDGLRETVGDEAYRKFMRELWAGKKQATETLGADAYGEMKGWVTEHLAENEFDLYKTIDKYLKQAAEKGEGGMAMWQGVRDGLQQATGAKEMSLREARWLSWLNGRNSDKNNPEHGMKKSAARWRIFRRSKDTAPTTPDGDFYREGSSQDVIGSRYNGGGNITAKGGVARAAYNEAVNRASTIWEEAYVDYAVSLKKAMLAISGAKDINDIDGEENAYLAENHLSSIVAQKEMQFFRDYFDKLQDIVNACLPDLHSNTKKAIEKLERYMRIKHGLERNREFFVRDWLKMAEIANKNAKPGEEIDVERIDYEWRKAKWDMLSDLMFGNITYRYYLEKLDDFIKNNISQEWDSSLLVNDRSGIRNYATKAGDAFEEGELLDEVEMIEATLGEKADVLWSRINDVTDYSLQRSYEGGLITQENFDHVRSMFVYYVPLRGFADEQADDVYSYVGLAAKNFGRMPVMMTAKGRKSLSDSPLATMGVMALSSINQAERNKVKQKLLRFVRNRYDAKDKDRLISINRIWIVKNGVDASGNDVWEESFPDIRETDTADEVEEKVRIFNEVMSRLHASGDAMIRRANLRIPYRIKEGEKKQHMVEVKENGETYLLIVNGDPRMAQAINGLLNPSNTDPNTFWGKIEPLWSGLNRFMSSAFTSWNPSFVASNTIRDAIFSRANVATKEGELYAAKFIKNYWEIVYPEFMKGTLWKRYRKGLAPRNELENLFYEFMENGGETGYVQLRNEETWKNMILSSAKRSKRGKVRNAASEAAHLIPNKILDYNERAENIARFACYVTSRRSGRSVTRSIADAKDVSVNFNRKGAGWKSADKNLWAGLTAEFLRKAYLFFNPGVQSLALMMRNVKKHALRFAAYQFGIHFAMGMMMPILNRFLASLYGDGDDDDNNAYANLPEWTRRNNLCIYAGNNNFVTIPLPIELRAFYGLGDIAAAYFIDGELKSIEPPYKDIMGQLSQLSPLDFMGEGGSVSAALVPDAVKPISQVKSNRDWTGKPIQKNETKLNKDYPEWTKAFRSEKRWAVNAAKWMSDKTGGDNERPGVVNISPAYATHILEGYTGGMGKTVSEIGDFGRMIINNDFDELNSRNMPIAKVVYNQANDRTIYYRTRAKFYKYNEEVETYNNWIRGYKNDMSDPLAASKALKLKEGIEGAKIKMIGKANKELEKIRKRRNNMTNKDDIKYSELKEYEEMESAVRRIEKIEEMAEAGKDWKEYLKQRRSSGRQEGD